MCGIVGIAAKRDISALLVECLHRLEYRGYDSAGLAVLDGDNHLHRLRALGKVTALGQMLKQQPLNGQVGIAHTRWATHGAPSEKNAHPHFAEKTVAVVHNGIIENSDDLRKKLIQAGYQFDSQTDTEVVTHLIHHQLKNEHNYIDGLQKVKKQLKGAYALAILLRNAPGEIFLVSKGCPLVIGVGREENYVASDQLALLPLTRQFIYLEEGDMAEISHHAIKLYNGDGHQVTRPVASLEMSHIEIGKGEFRHFMQKEIFEQATSITQTLEGRIDNKQIDIKNTFGNDADKIFPRVKQVHIVACGTSFHAGMVAKYWLESLVGIPCSVEIASEYRYRDFKVPDDTLFVSISQSGETADTLAALRKAKTLNYLTTLAICNVETSTLVRESDFALLTRAGAEIGVASTKAFTTQLVALMLLTMGLGRYHHLSTQTEKQLVAHLHALPQEVREVLSIDGNIRQLVSQFVESQNMLFLGRGVYYPIALEGALKVKELSYIHAEAYPAGELKHGPLALVDKKMPVLAIVDNDSLLEKLMSNLNEVRARGGQLFVFTNTAANIANESGTTLIPVPALTTPLSPILYTVPLQMFAYHVACAKGTDVDQPRNLAKSVTVE